MKRQRLTYLLIPAALTILIYAKAGDNRYAVDDVPIVLENKVVQQSAPAGKIWLAAYWDTERFPDRGLYRPLAIQTFRWTHLLFGNDVAKADHWINILLHAINGGLLFLLLSRFGAAPAAAALIAALFVAHPVHSEVVASLVGRTDLLALLFLLMGALMIQNPWAVGITALASLCAKESTVLLILLLPLMDNSSKASSRRKQLWCAAGVALIAYLALRWLALHEVGVPGIGRNRFGDNFFVSRWTALAFDSYFFQKLVAPLPLLYDYGIGLFKPGSLEAHLRAALTLLGFTGMVVWITVAWRRQRQITAPLLGGILWLAALAPVANLAIIIGTPFAERLLYVAVPFLGFCLLQSRFCESTKEGWRFKGAVLLITLLILPLAATITWMQSSAWRDNLALTERTLENYGENADLRVFHAWALVEAGAPDRAFATLETAINNAPTYYLPRLEQAKLLCLTGKKQEAQAGLARALALVDNATAQAIIGELQRQQNCIYR